jgi:hypothetical protein
VLKWRKLIKNKTRWLQASLALCAQFTLVGCVTTDVAKTTPSDAVATGKSDGGCVSLVMGFDPSDKTCAHFTQNTIWYSAVGATKAGSFALINDSGGSTIDVDVPSFKATAMRACLKPGLYELTSTSFYNGATGKSLRSQSPFSIKFDVRLGDELQLGRLTVERECSKSFLGSSYPVSGSFFVTELISKDVEAIRRKYPQFENGSNAEIDWSSANPFIKFGAR